VSAESILEVVTERGYVELRGDVVSLTEFGAEYVGKILENQECPPWGDLLETIWRGGTKWTQHLILTRSGDLVIYREQPPGYDPSAARGYPSRRSRTGDCRCTTPAK
jgi:hypothetical protein